MGGAIRDLRSRNTSPSLIFRETELSGCFVIQPEAFLDERGFFSRIFCGHEFQLQGLSSDISQVSLSHNTRAGTLRGLHFQTPPCAEEKLVRCIRGRVFDVAVDIERRRWTALELSEHNGLSIYIPKGFAHGFLTLEPESTLLYQISVPFEPAASSGVRWDDPSLAIDWPSVPELIISPRDRSLPNLR